MDHLPILIPRGLIPLHGGLGFKLPHSSFIAIIMGGEVILAAGSYTYAPVNIHSYYKSTSVNTIITITAYQIIIIDTVLVVYIYIS